MLSFEDQKVLGFHKDDARRRSTAVSQILRKISDDLKSPPGDWDVTIGAEDQRHFHIVVVSDRDARRRAYALAYRVYCHCGYTSEESELLTSPYDADPHTVTLLAQDENDHDCATVTLNFDSSAGLPGDEIYPFELNALRAQSRQIVEVTRLAVSDEYARSKTLLVRLFNFIYIFARRVRGFDDFVIEVNPRHANFYNRLLFFEQLGPERPCPRVQNAHSVLLRMDLHRGENEIRRASGKRAKPDDHTLYPYFYSWLEEGAVAEFLAQSHRPMSSDDKKYFGLTPRENIRAAIA